MRSRVKSATAVVKKVPEQFEQKEMTPETWLNFSDPQRLRLRVWHHPVKQTQSRSWSDLILTVWINSFGCLLFLRLVSTNQRWLKIKKKIIKNSREPNQLIRSSRLKSGIPNLGWDRYWFNRPFLFKTQFPLLAQRECPRALNVTFCSFTSLTRVKH